jgi:hypothetical protein
MAGIDTQACLNKARLLEPVAPHGLFCVEKLKGEKNKGNITRRRGAMTAEKTRI